MGWVRGWQRPLKLGGQGRPLSEGNSQQTTKTKISTKTLSSARLGTCSDEETSYGGFLPPVSPQGPQDNLGICYKAWPLLLKPSRLPKQGESEQLSQSTRAQGDMTLNFNIGSRNSKMSGNWDKIWTYKNTNISTWVRWLQQWAALMAGVCGRHGNSELSSLFLQDWNYSKIGKMFLKRC